MNVAMLLQIALTKYHNQVLLHDTEIIILTWDTILDLHLAITIGTDTGLTDQGHIPIVTGTEVHSWSNFQRSHTRSYHRCPHRCTSCHGHSNTYRHQQNTPHRRSSYRSSSTHSRNGSRSRSHNWHRTTHMACSKPTYSSSRTVWKNKDKKYKQVIIDDPHLIITVLMNYPVHLMRI